MNDRKLAIPDAYALRAWDMPEWGEEVRVDQYSVCELCEKAGTKEINESADH